MGRTEKHLYGLGALLIRYTCRLPVKNDRYPIGLNSGTLTHTGAVTLTNALISLQGLPVHDSEASASAAFMASGSLYQTSGGAIRIKL